MKYLSFVVVLLLCGTPLYGQDDDYNPTNPGEPGAPPPPKTQLTVVANPVEGGNVNGGGKYAEGAQVSLSCGNKTNFAFVNWTNEAGEVVSTTTSFKYTKGAKAETLTANFEYTPGNPSEPVPGTSIVLHRLTVVAGDGGSVSGGGRYLPGKSVTVSASCQQNYEFSHWTNAAGEVVATTASYKYVMQEYAETLTAHFNYNPGNPDEPADPIVRRRIFVDCTDGGTVSSAIYALLPGQSARLTATPNDGYAFVGWYLDGTLYTALNTFSYTIGEENVRFEARFEYNPADPGEPVQPTDNLYALYLMGTVAYPGKTVDCPLYLTSLKDMKDLSFQLTFTEDAEPDWSTLTLGEQAAGYTASITETATAGVYQVSLVGGTVTAGNRLLFSVKVNVKNTTTPATVHPVLLNQVSLTQPDNSTITASVRNGRITVFELGDTNGDFTVDISDKMNMVMHVVGDTPDNFIPEVSDANEDGTLDISDGMTILNIMFNNASQTGAANAKNK